MKHRMGNQLLQSTVLLSVTVLLMSLAGRLAGYVRGDPVCDGWPLCAPASQADWFKGAHVVLAILAGLLILRLLIKAWNEYRADPEMVVKTLDRNTLLAQKTITTLVNS